MRIFRSLKSVCTPHLTNSTHKSIAFTLFIQHSVYGRIFAHHEYSVQTADDKENRNDCKQRSEQHKMLFFSHSKMQSIANVIHLRKERKRERAKCALYVLFVFFFSNVWCLFQVFECFQCTIFFFQVFALQNCCIFEYSANMHWHGQRNANRTIIRYPNRDSNGSRLHWPDTHKRKPIDFFFWRHGENRQRRIGVSHDEHKKRQHERELSLLLSDMITRNENGFVRNCNNMWAAMAVAHQRKLHPYSQRVSRFSLWHHKC